MVNKNLILTGGSSQVHGLKKRLQKDLKDKQEEITIKEEEH
jgi:actin-related protein